jgi:hypothetical protein
LPGSSDLPSVNKGRAGSRWDRGRRGTARLRKRSLHMKRIVIFGLLAAILWTAENIWLSSRQPEISKVLALQQVNGGDQAARHLREFEMLKDGLHVLTGTLTLLVALACFNTWIRRGSLYQKFSQTGVHGAVALLCSVSLLGLTSGCVREYDRPEYVEIDTSETGFLIPLEGDSTEQVKFQSEDYLKQHKVATKRVQITHRWSQEGRWPTDGKWILNGRNLALSQAAVVPRSGVCRT